MKELRHKQVEEIHKYTNSMSYLMAGAAGPDGGMAAQQASLDSLRINGKWNSKHTEDYIKMVKDELKKQKITVTPEMEKKMIDKMIKDEIPKSSIDYIMKKAATSTLFYLPQALKKSPLENHISAQAEKKYNPKGWEKGAGYALGATADYLTTAGIGGGWGTAAKFIGVDVALNTCIDAVSKDDDVPIVIAPEHRKEYKKQKAKEAAKKESKAESKTDAKPQKAAESKKEGERHTAETQSTEEQNVEESTGTTPPQEVEEQSSEQTTNQNGWTGLLSSFGLNGLSDIGNNLGYVLAMLPDILFGTFSGKTHSLGLKNNLMPLASIVAGMFVRNPIMKMVLIGMGGLNLINKAGHEAIEMHQGQGQNQGTGAGTTFPTHYKVYQDEMLNPRISDPQIKGNCLIATIDRVPCTIALPDKVVDAYIQGALPLNTLANAVLAKNDQMRQMASDNYEAQQRTETRTLAQR